MISVADLWSLLDSLVPAPLAAESVPIAAAVGRVLRQPVLADTDQPPFNRSAFDGYLARLQPPGPVSLLGAIPPGVRAPDAPAPGYAWRVLTGTALPDGPVGIVMQEDTSKLDDGRIELRATPSARLIRHRASQCRAGDLLLPSGSVLTAGAVALLASVGNAHPLVTRRPRVVHIVTGDELVPAETKPAPGQIRDTNSSLIAALLAAAGAELVFSRRIEDTHEAGLTALQEALAHAPDVLLVSGGAGGGDHDHTRALLKELGFVIHADKVSSRPGKPLVTASRGPLIAFGLPGNPLSHFVCFHLFVHRVLVRFAGAAPTPLLPARLAPDASLAPDPRETWWPCILGSSGPMRIASPLPWRDSSDLTALASANALIRLPSTTPVGADVEVLPCLFP